MKKNTTTLSNEKKMRSVITTKKGTELASINSEIVDAIVTGPAMTLSDGNIDYDESILDDYYNMLKKGNPDLQIVNEAGSLASYIIGRRDVLTSMFNAYKDLLLNSLTLQFINSLTHNGIYVYNDRIKEIISSSFPTDPRAYFNIGIKCDETDLHILNNIIPLKCFEVMSEITNNIKLFSISHIGEDCNSDKYYDRSINSKELESKLNSYDIIINGLIKSLHASLIIVYDSLKNYAMNLLVEVGYPGINIAFDDEQLDNAIKNNPDTTVIREF